jgi:hypothetical protein
MKNIEKQVKDIEEKKRLQELAGVKSSSNDDEAEKLWGELQKEIEYIIHLAKNNPNEYISKN